MAKDEHLKILRQGVNVWNEWRDSRPGINPDLFGANLHSLDLSRANLSNTDLRSADLSYAKLNSANLNSIQLRFADLRMSNLRGANFRYAHGRSANLHGANLSSATLESAAFRFANFNSANFASADLRHVNLSFSDLSSANLNSANLSSANFSSANLNHANFNLASLHNTILANVDLSNAIGLEKVMHRGPSELSISTIYLSKGRIHEAFLRGCGIPEEFITHIPALIAAIQPIQFYSCFISYSSQDTEFAQRLHSRLREAGLRVWFAPEDIKGGEKIFEQIDQAIKVYDRLLLVLSESSLLSEWVATELRRARKVEIKEKRRKVFPIRLVSFDILKEWECIDADHGKDLAVEVREYFIPDFSNWKNHDDFEKAFAHLLAALKAGT